MPWAYTVQYEVGNPVRGLIVEAHKGLDPAIVITRDGGGEVIIELDQIHALIDVLQKVASDLASETIEAQGDMLVHCTGCGSPMHVAVYGPDYYCEKCTAASGETRHEP
jgi:hypothetical protein